VRPDVRTLLAYPAEHAGPPIQDLDPATARTVMIESVRAADLPMGELAATADLRRSAGQPARVVNIPDPRWSAGRVTPGSAKK